MGCRTFVWTTKAKLTADLLLRPDLAGTSNAQGKIDLKKSSNVPISNKPAIRLPFSGDR
jgi:hypothetical protein